MQLCGEECASRGSRETGMSKVWQPILGGHCNLLGANLGHWLFAFVPSSGSATLGGKHARGGHSSGWHYKLWSWLFVGKYSYEHICGTATFGVWLRARKGIFVTVLWQVFDDRLRGRDRGVTISPDELSVGRSIIGRSRVIDTSNVRGRKKMWSIFLRS